MYIMELVLVLVIISIVVVILYKFKKDKKASVIQHQPKTIKQNEEQQRIDAIEKQYGRRGATLDKTSLHVWVFDETRKVVIYNDDFDKREVYSFDDIIRCDLKSNDNINKTIIPVQSETTYVTKTSGTSMAGRALVGAVIAGPVGAIIGGATAKKTTVSVTKNIPTTTFETVNTTWSAVLHVLKDGVDHSIPCYGYGSNKLKSMIDEIISNRNIQTNKIEG